jgi:hypothetical protein
MNVHIQGEELSVEGKLEKGKLLLLSPWSEKGNTIKLQLLTHIPKNLNEYGTRYILKNFVIAKLIIEYFAVNGTKVYTYAY